MRRKDQGFTLLELLITISIIFILASIIGPLSSISAKREKEIQLRHHLRTMRLAIDTFNEDWNRDGPKLVGLLCQKNRMTCLEVSSSYGYPKTLETLLGVELSGEEATVRGTTLERYLRRIPPVPMTQSLEWGLRCYRDDPDTDSWCGDDLFDVYCDCPGTALNGTHYRDW